MAAPPAVRPNVAPSLLVMRGSKARAAASPSRAIAMACAASTARRRDRTGRGRARRLRRIAEQLRIGRTGEGVVLGEPTSSMASDTKRSIPASVRSLVDVVATRLP
jgi:hypothetical protein